MHLDTAFAESFILKLTAYTSYNINIMDQKGIIIASRNPERIGSFHEIAFDVISNRRDVMEVSEPDEFLGVQPGVNLAVTYEGEWIGVVGVTGNPGEVKPIAMIIKMAMETMLEYEQKKERMLKRQNLKEQFISRLVYEENTDRLQLKNIAKKLGYRERCLRIPVVFVPPQEQEPEESLQLLKEGSLHTPQDISIVTQDKKLLIFKTLPEGETLLADYQYFVREYLEDFLERSDQKSSGWKFYAGSIQNQFSNYRSAYGHCTWLENHITVEQKPVFFYDYVDDYMKDVIPVMELHQIFNVFSREFSSNFIENYLEIMGILKKNSYNLEAASKELFVHKNTLTFRLDKIRNTLDMNPIRESRDREFMEYLYYYLKK